MKRRAGDLLLTIWLPVALVGVWYVASAGSESLFFPPLSEIWHSFDESFLTFDAIDILGPSLAHLLLGYAAAALVGVCGGIALGVSRPLRDLTGASIHFVRSIPPVALVPFAIVAFGLGSSMKIWLIAFAAVFPILLNTIDGVRSMDPLVHETASVYRLPFARKVTSVVVPAASPQIFAGLRVGLQVALLLMVVSELYASTSGIGYYILQAQSRFEITDMWAGMIVLGLLGFLINELFIRAERRALRWYIGSRGEVLR